MNHSQQKVTFRLSERYSQQLDALVKSGHSESRHLMAKQLVMIALDAPERDALMQSLTSLHQRMGVLASQCQENQRLQTDLAASFATAFELLFMTLHPAESSPPLESDRIHDVMTALFLEA